VFDVFSARIHISSVITQLPMQTSHKYTVSDGKMSIVSKDIIIHFLWRETHCLLVGVRVCCILPDVLECKCLGLAGIMVVVIEQICCMENLETEILLLLCFGLAVRLKIYNIFFIFPCWLWPNFVIHLSVPTFQ
jgi:hypothetical protein